MMGDESSGFVPGARVAVQSGYSEYEYREARVAKVYKNGNFTLEGSPQQWKPWRRVYSDPPQWSASRTGGGYHRDIALLWDDATDKELTEKVAAHKRAVRFHDFRRRVERCRGTEAWITEEVMAALEAALPKPPPEPKP